MKYPRKLTTLLLAALMLTGSVACTGKGDGTATTVGQDTPAEVTTVSPPEETVGETETDTVPETDTDIETETDNDPMPEVGAGRSLSSVTIVAGESAAEAYAVSELTKYLGMKGVTIQEDSYRIKLKIDPAMEEDSYKIAVFRKNNDGTTITAGNGRGLLYGVYRFLENQAGIRYFTPQLEVVPEGKMMITTGYEAYQPAFEFRENNWFSAKTDAAWSVKNGINCNSGSIPAEMGDDWSYGGYFVHTLSSLTGTDSSAQPCLTDPAILEKTIAKVREVLAARPDARLLSVSQNDNQNYCTCDRCAAVDAEEGSPAGTLLRFVNAVAADIAEDYPHVVIDTLAYQYTRKPPLKTRPLPNVCIRLCSIECCWMHPMSDPTCEVNAAFVQDLLAWNEICDRIYIWDYTANFSYYIPTYPNFNVLRDNMRFFADHGVKGMFPQGNFSSASGEFGELRQYLLAKLMMDPYMTAATYYRHMDEFLKAYYGEGWMYIRAYIDYVCGEAASAHSSIRSNPFDLVPEEKYRAMEETLDAWWNKAEELAGDRLAFVQRSRLQWRYIQLMLHPNEEIAKVFVADVEAAGVYWNEWRTTKLPEKANLALPPDHWDWDY